MRKIPSTMASQHPDHASKPYWHSEEFIAAQHEYKECYLSFADLGIGEYKWDWEGKLVDESVMERLLSEHYNYFLDNPLGKETFLTFRLPNPKIEIEFRIARAFINILSAAGLAKQLKLPTPPLFEVILPMTETAHEMIDIQDAFLQMKELKHKLYRFDTESIQNLEVIPLFEQVETIMNSDKILKKYLTFYKSRFKTTPFYLRPYVARSDPALNSGLVPTVLAIKVALSKYKEFSNQNETALFPIIGSASLPFRGGLTPLTVEQFVDEYQGIKTALIQSAFRYDYDRIDVSNAVKKLGKLLPKNQPKEVSIKEEKEIRKLIPHFEKNYKTTIEEIAPLINEIALFLPKRRERVQHTGLFGYSRGVGKVSLPRAIGFTASLYSIGIPPELIGTGRGIKKAKEMGILDTLEKHYVYLKENIVASGKFLNIANLQKLAKTSQAFADIAMDVRYLEEYAKTKFSPQSQQEREHEQLTGKIYKKISSHHHPKELLQKAGVLRKSMG